MLLLFSNINSVCSHLNLCLRNTQYNKITLWYYIQADLRCTVNISAVSMPPVQNKNIIIQG